MKTKYKEIANHETYRIFQGSQMKKATRVKKVLTRGTKPINQSFARIYLTDNGQASGNAVFANLNSEDITFLAKAIPTTGAVGALDDSPWDTQLVIDSVNNKFVDVYVQVLDVDLLSSAVSYYVEDACAVDLKVEETKYD